MSSSGGEGREGGKNEEGEGAEQEGEISKPLCVTAWERGSEDESSGWVSSRM